MEISQGSLAYMLLLSFLLGAVLGAIYDAVRIIRVFLTLGEGSKSKFALSAIRKLKLPWLRETCPAEITMLFSAALPKL